MTQENDELAQWLDDLANWCETNAERDRETGYIQLPVADNDLRRMREAATSLRQQSEEVPETFPKTVWLRENDGVFEFTDEGDPCGFAYSAGQSEDSARLLSALSEAADELDSYYRAEYLGADAYPSIRRKLEHAIANNPARIAIDKARK